MKAFEACNCILRESENRHKYEVGYLADKYTVQDIVHELIEEGLHVHSVIVENHMKRHISAEAYDEFQDYLPSVAAQCAEMLTKVKSQAMKFLARPNLEKNEIALLNTLLGATNKALDKYGQITGEALSIETPVVDVHIPNGFEEDQTKLLKLLPSLNACTLLLLLYNILTLP